MYGARTPDRLERSQKLTFQSVITENSKEKKLKNLFSDRKKIYINQIFSYTLIQFFNIIYIVFFNVPVQIVIGKQHNIIICTCLFEDNMVVIFQKCQMKYELFLGWLKLKITVYIYRDMKLHKCVSLLLSLIVY